MNDIKTVLAPVYLSENSSVFPDFKLKAQVATCVVEWNGRYLFLKRAKKEDQSDTWGIPGGKLEKDETALQALSRELFEELSWKLSEDTFSFRGKFYGRVPGWDYILHVFHYCLQEAPLPIILDAKEHSEYAWTNLEEMKNLKLLKGQDVALEKINLKGDFHVGRIHVTTLLKKTSEIGQQTLKQKIQPFFGRYIINLIGTTGVGKGTQGEFLERDYQYAHISIGDLFRKEILDRTDLGAQILWHDERTESSRYNPDEITLGIMAKRLSQIDCQKGFILDGFPRTKAQSLSLMQTFLRPDDVHIPIWMKIDDQHIYDRVVGRFICSDCGVQARGHQQLKKIGYCDQCDGQLIKRVEDASRDKITKRLKIFTDNIDEVLEEIRQYDNVYVMHLNPTHTPDEVYQVIHQLVSEKIGH